MNRKEMVDKLVEQDLEDIVQEIVYRNESEFTENVLRGNGWKPYNQLTDKEVISEYKDRIESEE